MTIANHTNFPKLLTKCAIIGLIMPITGCALQIIAKRFILGISDKPSAGFIASVAILFFAEGFLFALGYHLFHGKIPGKSKLTKGIFYGLMVSMSAYFGNIINLIVIDNQGLSDLLTPWKINRYLTTANDTINFVLSGAITGIILEGSPISVIRDRIRNSKYITSSIIGFFVFPVIGFIMWKLFGALTSIGLPGDDTILFHLYFWIPLAFTCGIFIPIFYLLVESLIKGTWIAKGLKFTALFFFLYMFVMSFFAIPVDNLSISVVIFFWAAVVPPLTATILITAKINT